jgi:phosphate starvation-inducible membrane PsiE
MLSDLLLRLGSHVMSAIMGGMAVFCLFYAGRVRHHNLVRDLLIHTLIYGGGAAVIVYFKSRYLDV